MKLNARLLVVSAIATILPALDYSRLSLDSTAVWVIVYLVPVLLFFALVFGGKKVERRLLLAVSSLALFMLVYLALLQFYFLATPALSRTAPWLIIYGLYLIGFVSWYMGGWVIVQVNNGSQKRLKKLPA